jgi:hypothetical protein
MQNWSFKFNMFQEKKEDKLQSEYIAAPWGSKASQNFVQEKKQTN